MSGLLQIDKEYLKKLIAEVKETVTGIIHLPAEKKISLEGVWNVKTAK